MFVYVQFTNPPHNVLKTLTSRFRSWLMSDQGTPSTRISIYILVDGVSWSEINITRFIKYIYVSISLIVVLCWPV